MTQQFYTGIEQELRDIEAQGLTKPERLITSPQNTKINVHIEGKDRSVINFCANNYLGLADHPALAQAAQETMTSHGFGLASVRFICGTQDLHRVLEKRIAKFFGYDDAITFAACFDANGAVFEPLFGKEDAIISDSLNHASIIDGVRLCKAMRFRYANNDMDDLEAKLIEAKAAGARNILIVTDGVFSMDGTIANLQGITTLAKSFGALTMVDDCHASGFLGADGLGSAQYCGGEGSIDILTSTLGKALGGGMGGFICARQEVVDLLKQKARPYLFSNALTPALVGASIKAFELVEEGDALRARLIENATRFRDGLTKAGFTLKEGAAQLLGEGVYVIGFSYPVVPKGEARIRTQISAAHTPEQIDHTIASFIKVGRMLDII